MEMEATLKLILPEILTPKETEVVKINLKNIFVVEIFLRLNT